MIQGGDFLKGDGTGRMSVYGEKFADEAGGLRARHAGPGILAMVRAPACAFTGGGAGAAELGVGVDRHGAAWERWRSDGAGRRAGGGRYGVWGYGRCCLRDASRLVCCGCGASSPPTHCIALPIAIPTPALTHGHPTSPHPRPPQANSGPDTNGCQFYVTCARTEWLDGKHVVFGRVLDAASLLVVRKVEHVPAAAGNRPRVDIAIAECGEM
jgi:cyclophilin family peptidyl-prolyl cis-trans isomerase